MKSIIIPAAVGAALMLAPAAAQADPGTADLAITRIGISQHGDLLRVRADVRDLGPDESEVAVDVQIVGATYRRIVCTANGQRFFDASDGTTCEVANLYNPTDVVGNITTASAVPGSVVLVRVRTYDMEGQIDPNPGNDQRIVKVRVR